MCVRENQGDGYPENDEQISQCTAWMEGWMEGQGVFQPLVSCRRLMRLLAGCSEVDVRRQGKVGVPPERGRADRPVSELPRMCLVLSSYLQFGPRAHPTLPYPSLEAIRTGFTALSGQPQPAQRPATTGTAASHNRHSG